MTLSKSVQGVPFLVSALVISVLGFAAENDALSIPEAWVDSAHGNSSSESFNHWNKDNEIPVQCAACHAKSGFLDYLGADGSEAGKVDKPAPIGSVIDCETCHNAKAEALSSVTFPSGAIIDNVEASRQCLVCHQGRESTVSVNSKLAGISEDSVSSDLTFINVHYRAAAATAFGSEVQGGYEYADRDYVGRFQHPPPANTCVGCHDPHSLFLEVGSCSICHNSDDPMAIRFDPQDYDGDADTTEGIFFEIQSLHTALSKAIRQYSTTVSKQAIVYSPDQYPYFFHDKNEDGDADDTERTYPNRYQQWTPRLLKAAYNYQFVAKDPGAYVHNPKYILQLLYDSNESLSKAMETQPSNFTRPE